MLMLRESCSPLWMRFLVQLVYILSLTLVQTRSLENGRTHYQTEMGSTATILESEQSYNQNLSNPSNNRNSSLFCIHEFFNSRTNHTEINLPTNSIIPYVQHRMKRCPPEYRAQLNSARLAARSKVQQRIEELKNEISARQLKAGTSSESSFENQRQNGQPIDKKRSFQNTKVATNVSNFTPSKNSVGRESGSNSSLTSNQTEKHKEMVFDDHNMEKETEKIFEDFETNSNLEKSTTKQTIATIFRHVNQNDSETSTEDLTEKTKLITNFEKVHNFTTPSLESNSPRPDANFLTIYQNKSEILNSRDSLKPSNDTSDSKGEWSLQTSKFASLNAPLEFEFSNNYVLDHDSRAGTVVVSSTHFPKIPQENVMPSIRGDKPNSFDFHLPSTNDNENDSLKEGVRLGNDSFHGNLKFMAPSLMFSSDNVAGRTKPSMSSVSTTENYTYSHMPATNMSNKFEGFNSTLSILLGGHENFQKIQKNLPIVDKQGSSILSLSDTSVDEKYDQNYKQNKNYSTYTTPVVESLKATEANVIIKSRDKEKFLSSSKLNTETTKQLAKNQEAVRNSEIINKINERLDITEPQIKEYGSVLTELLQKDNVGDRNSSEMDLEQKLFGVAPTNRHNRTGNLDGNSYETAIEQSANSENTQKTADQMNSVEQPIQEMADQTKDYEPTQILPVSSLHQSTYTKSTNYENHKPEIQASDSLSTHDYLVSTEAVSPLKIFTQVHEDPSDIKNSVPASTDSNYFKTEMENFSEEHTQLLVKKSLRHSHKVPKDENLPFSHSTDLPNRSTSRKYKLKHFSSRFKENMLKRKHSGTINSTPADQESLHIPKTTATDLPIADHPPTAESPSTTLNFAAEDWSTTDSPNQSKNIPSILQIQNNSDFYIQNFVNPKVTRRAHKIQPGEVVPPMNPNENWKIGQNDTYYTIEELKSFFKKSRAAGKGMKKYPLEIVIDLNGLNETIIIDFLKHNLTSFCPNETISSNTTKYKIFRLFSNSTDNFDRVRNESSTSKMTSVYSLTTQDLHETANSSTSATLDPNLETSKYLEQLKKNLFNATKADENALKFVQDLLSLNETFLMSNLDLNENNFNATSSTEHVSNLEDMRNTEVILVNLKDPQSAKELIEKLSCGCHKIVVIAGKKAAVLRNAPKIVEKINFTEDNINIKELSITDDKNLMNSKNIEDIEGKANSSAKNNLMQEKSISSSEVGGPSHHNFRPASSHHFKAKPRDQEQLIKEQFSFVNPQIVDSFLDVYKRYSPPHSASRSKKRPHNYSNTAKSSWNARSHQTRSNEPPDNFLGNLLRELVRLKSSLPAAYVSHGHAA